MFMRVKCGQGYACIDYTHLATMTTAGPLGMATQASLRLWCSLETVVLEWHREGDCRGSGHALTLANSRTS